MCSINMDGFEKAVKMSLGRLNKSGMLVKEKQRDALFSVVVERKDTLCVLPTGYGKSLIYQILPFLFDLYPNCEDTDSFSSSVIVISPLNALMIDQISKLEDYMSVTVLRSSSVDNSADSGHVNQSVGSQIIFAHPESLLEDKRVFHGLLKSNQLKNNLKAIVVDEAHLILEWKEFRPYYGKLGMLASLFPDLPIIALTATATKKMKDGIATSLGMLNPKLIELNPDRPNIFFKSCRRPNTGEDKLYIILEPLIEELKNERLDFPLTLIYGNLATVAECYSIASRSMGMLQYEPVGSEPIGKNRMFSQFHAHYPDYLREQIIKELVAGTSKLRLLFVTVAFGIGIDVQSIRRVVHIGVPLTVEEFFQEAGRCGRDGLVASSIIYYNSYDISSSRGISSDMIQYVSGDVCKRKKLLSYFGHSLPERSTPEHSCCDVHAKNCGCDDCLLDATSEMFRSFSTKEDMEVQPVSDKCLSQPFAFDPVQLSKEQKDELRNRLINYRQTLHGSGRSCVGSLSLCTGFSMELIEEVVRHANELVSVEEVKKKLPLFDSAQAVTIFEIVKGVLE